MKSLQEAIKFLEDLQEFRKRPFDFGMRDVLDLIGSLEDVILGLKQFQIDLQNESDSGEGRSLE